MPNLFKKIFPNGLPQMLRSNKIAQEESSNSGVEIKFYSPSKLDRATPKGGDEFYEFVKKKSDEKVGIEGKLQKKTVKLKRVVKRELFRLPYFLRRVVGLDELSFNINKKSVLKIADDILNIMRDPKIVLKCLKSLDEELGKKMLAKGISLEDNSPQYFIAGGGNFMVGPPPKDYKPYRKNKILNEILLDREKASGINLQGVAVFDKFVEVPSANQFVANGNVFSENEQRKNLLQHGKFSHRFAFEVLRQAVAKDILDIKPLNFTQLLEIFAKVKIDSNKSNIWTRTIDSGDFSETYNRRDPSYYSNSARNPEALKSLITCLGKEDVPNLYFYTLDSHYKQMAQMVNRAKNNDINRNLEGVSDDILHTYCSIYMNSGFEINPAVIIDTPFSMKDAEASQKYESFSAGSKEGIMKKKTAPAPKNNPQGVRYESLAQYVKEKAVKETARGGSVEL